MHVRPATNLDVPALATCFARAFEDDKLFAALHPRRSEFRADFTASFERLFQTQLCKRNCIVLVVDGDEGTTQTVAGVAVWERDGTDGGRDINPRAGILLDLELTLINIQARLWPTIDRSEDPEVRMQFEAALARIGEEDKLIPPARWHLKYVAVDPAFQRRGVGALLVRAGMERAREEGVPVMLEASPNGEKLYEKLGFVVVGEMLLRGAGVGGPVMRWDPPTSEDENGAIA